MLLTKQGQILSSQIICCPGGEHRNRSHSGHQTGRRNVYTDNHRSGYAVYAKIRIPVVRVYNLGLIRRQSRKSGQT
jgi:hypothetical protein